MRGFGQVDETFTLAIGGMMTLLNTSGSRLSAGDHIAWTLNPRHANTSPGLNPEKKMKLGCRRIGIVKCHSAFDPQIIGRVLTFSKVGEPFDVVRALWFQTHAFLPLATASDAVLCFAVDQAVDEGHSECLESAACERSRCAPSRGLR